MSSLLASDLEVAKENVLPIKKGRDVAGENFFFFFSKTRIIVCVVSSMTFEWKRSNMLLSIRLGVQKLEIEEQF